MPASNIPSRKRTPHIAEKLWTKAVPSEQMPKPKEIAGIYQPGPMTLQRMFEGIYKYVKTWKQTTKLKTTYLENNVADIENTENSIVVITLHLKILL
jgi:hypothetical protein